MKIRLTDHMEISPKGRACKARRTEYTVQAEGLAGYEEAVREHRRRVGTGEIEAPARMTLSWTIVSD